MKVKIVLISLVFILMGCALSNQWTTEVVEDNNRGEKPVNYEVAIKEYLGNALKDPFSMKLKNMSEPKEGSTSDVEILQSPTLINVNGRKRETIRHGWLVTVDVNAKNGYGAYTGWETYSFIFRDENIIHTSN